MKLILFLLMVFLGGWGVSYTKTKWKYPNWFWVRVPVFVTAHIVFFLGTLFTAIELINWWVKE